MAKLAHGKPRAFFLSESNDSERSRSEVELPNKNNKQSVCLLSFSAMPWFVYIAQAPTDRYYTGITTDPNRRIQEHNHDEGAKFAHDQGALRLLYASSAFPDQSSARIREVQIKGWTRAKKEKLIRGEWT